VVIYVSREFPIFGLQAAFGERFFGGCEKLNGDFTGWFGDGDLKVLDAANFWVGAGGYLECVFGSIGVVFFVGYLICSESWS
jgi:Flp pilus assembly protein protease CpaA